MSARSFLDTNILIHADDKEAPAKQRRALDLVAAHRRAGAGVVSLHVLQEHFVAVTRKLHVEASVARRKVELGAKARWISATYRKGFTMPRPSTSRAS